MDIQSTANTFLDKVTTSTEQGEWIIGPTMILSFITDGLWYSFLKYPTELSLYVPDEFLKIFKSDLNKDNLDSLTDFFYEYSFLNQEEINLETVSNYHKSFKTILDKCRKGIISNFSIKGIPKNFDTNNNFEIFQFESGNSENKIKDIDENTSKTSSLAQIYINRIVEGSKNTNKAIFEISSKAFNSLGHYIYSLQIPDSIFKTIKRTDHLIGLKNNFISNKLFNFKGGKSVKVFIGCTIAIAGLKNEAAGIAGVIIAFADP